MWEEPLPAAKRTDKSFSFSLTKLGRLHSSFHETAKPQSVWWPSRHSQTKEVKNIINWTRRRECVLRVWPENVTIKCRRRAIEPHGIATSVETGTDTKKTSNEMRHHFFRLFHFFYFFFRLRQNEMLSIRRDAPAARRGTAQVCGPGPRWLGIIRDAVGNGLWCISGESLTALRIVGNDEKMHRTKSQISSMWNFTYFSASAHIWTLYGNVPYSIFISVSKGQKIQGARAREKRILGQHAIERRIFKIPLQSEQSEHTEFGRRWAKVRKTDGSLSRG